MRNETKLLLGLGLILLIVLPFIAIVIVDASEQETNQTTTPILRGLVGWLRNLRQRLGRSGLVEASEEFEAKVIIIVENDIDAQALLANGYSIAAVRPIIRSTVDGNSNVIAKGTTALVVLKNVGSKSFAMVLVDPNMGMVMKIVTFTRAVIK